MAIPIQVTSIHYNNQQMALLLWYHDQRHPQIITQTIPVPVQVVCHVITTAMAMVDIIRVLIKITTTTTSHAILATTNRAMRQLMKNFGFLGIHLDSIPDDETKYYKFPAVQ